MVNGVNDEPLAVDDAYSTTEDDAFEVNVPGRAWQRHRRRRRDILTVTGYDAVSALARP